jgi:hypothetical protein
MTFVRHKFYKSQTMSSKLPNIYCFLVILFTTQIGYSQISNKESTRKIKRDTITQLSQMKGDSAYWKHDGIITVVTYIPVDPSEDIIRTRKANECSDIFEGHDRMEAKTSFVKGRAKRYKNIGDLKVTLQSDALMRTMDIKDNSPRIEIEKRNVKVDTAYLYALKREDDNDYHLLVGDKSGENLFNCEVSGLPNFKNKYTKKLKFARTSFQSQLGIEACKFSRYLFFSPPVLVSLEGSLFFDVSHAAGGLGHKYLKPTSVWEIHPIREIKLY